MTFGIKCLFGLHYLSWILAAAVAVVFAFHFPPILMLYVMLAIFACCEIVTGGDAGW